MLQRPRDAVVARVLHEKARQLLDHRGLTPPALDASISNFLFEGIPERRWAEALPDVRHEGDYCSRKASPVALGSIDGVNESVEAGPRVSFPERDPTIEEGAKGQRRVVVTRQNQKRRLLSFELIDRLTILAREFVMEISLSPVLSVV